MRSSSYYQLALVLDDSSSVSLQVMKFSASDELLGALRELQPEFKRRAEEIRALPFDYRALLIDEWLSALSEESIKAQLVDAMAEATGFSREMSQLSLEELMKNFSLDNLLERLRVELQPISALDDWAYDLRSNTYLNVVPHGIALHVTPSNVPVNVLDTAMSGLATGNFNLIKVSSKLGLEPFLTSLEALERVGDLGKYVVMINFPSGERELEKTLVDISDLVVFWGGWEGAKAWRDMTPPEKEVVIYGPRYSAVLITKRALHSAPEKLVMRNLAFDISIWETRACSSPQIIFLMGFDVEESLVFAEKLGRALQEIEEELPIGDRAFNERTELLRVKDVSFWREQLRGDVKLVADEAMHWGLVVHFGDSFIPSPGYRWTTLKPVRDLQQLSSYLEPVRGYLQSVAILATPDEKLRLASLLTDLGFCRVTELGKLGISTPGAPHENEYQLRRFTKLISLENREPVYLFFTSRDEDEYEQFILRRLLALLEYAKRSPFYAERLRGITLKSLDHFREVPLLTSEDIREHGPAGDSTLLTEVTVKGAYVFSTGGTTGRPKYVAYSHQEFEQVAELLAKVYVNAGIEKGSKVANLFLAGNLWTSFIVVNKALESIGATVLPISGNTPMERIVEILLRAKPDTIIGIPTLIMDLASYVLRNSLDIRIPEVLYGGEHLTESALEFLREALGVVKAKSAGYASVDAGLIGFQCEYQRLGEHHVIPYYQYVEILDEGGNPAEEGEIVVTNLTRRLMPVIRYRTGDRGRWIEKPCKCGRRLRSFMLLGRVGDRFRVASADITTEDVERAISAVNSKYSALLLSHSYQVVIGEGTYGLSKMTLKVELAVPVDMELQRDLRHRLIEELKALNWQFKEELERGTLQVKVELLRAGEIPRNPRTGKIRKVVYELEGERR